MSRTICNNTTQNKSFTLTKTGRTATPVVETNFSDRKGVREVFLSYGFDKDTINILIAK